MQPTGPRTAEGKLRSRFNALKHGLTGQHISIHNDEREPYQAHVQAYIDLYKPVGHAEQVLVRNIADDYWRSLRGRALEYRHMNEALGGFPEHDKVLSNLSLYLNRIERSIRNNTQALETLQRRRRENERAQAERREAERKQSTHSQAAPNPGEFVFSNPQPADAAHASARSSGAPVPVPAVPIVERTADQTRGGR